VEPFRHLSDCEFERVIRIFMSRNLIYTIATYFLLEGAMAAKAGMNPKHTDAKLFWNGRSQAVRLPKEFRFEGDRVRVSRMGAGILLEPVALVVKESPEELFARMDAMGGDPIFPEGRKQNLAPIREYFK
jgi:antitoxin VapB